MRNPAIDALNKNRATLNESYRLLIIERNQLLDGYNERLHGIGEQIHEIDAEIKRLRMPMEV